jgi:hypothetical protein
MRQSKTCTELMSKYPKSQMELIPPQVLAGAKKVIR